MATAQQLIDSYKAMARANPAYALSIRSTFLRLSHQEELPLPKRHLLARKVFGWIWTPLDNFGFRHNFLTLKGDEYVDGWTTLETDLTEWVQVWDETEDEFEERFKTMPEEVRLVGPQASMGLPPEGTAK